jgi:hypothetical protein
MSEFKISTGDAMGDFVRPWMDEETISKLGVLTVEAPTLQEAMYKVNSLRKPQVSETVGGDKEI